jgi:hypothetical protein
MKVGTPEYIGHLARLETELLEWKDNLPALLKIHFDAALNRRLGNLEDVYARQGVILYLRYNNGMILLRRPHISAALSGQVGSTTVGRLASSGSIDLCMQVAKTLLPRSKSFIRASIISAPGGIPCTIVRCPDMSSPATCIISIDVNASGGPPPES